MGNSIHKIITWYCTYPISDYGKEVDEVISILKSENAAHKLYLRYGADTYGGRNYNEQIEDINNMMLESGFKILY